MKLKTIAIASLLLFSASYAKKSNYVCTAAEVQTSKKSLSDIIVPGGYERINLEKGSFAEWMRNLPLKENNEILDYEGRAINSFFYSTYAVIAKNLLFKQDLEQCADFTMRFWHDYHKETGQEEKLWLPNYNGKKVYWKDWKKAKNKDLKSYLKHFMANSNSFSLKKGLNEIKEEEFLPGDIIVQNDSGGIGHVSVVFDICKNKDCKKLYLIGFSFMPAQECHIEKADSDH